MDEAIKHLEAYKDACEKMLTENERSLRSEHYRNLAKRVVAVDELIKFFQAGGGDAEAAKGFIYHLYD